MAVLATNNVIDYSAGGDTVDTFSQKVKDEIEGHIYGHLNNIITMFAKNTEPTAAEGLQPYMLWADTLTNKIKQRNSGNSDWIVVGLLNLVNNTAITYGTSAIGAPSANTVGQIYLKHDTGQIYLDTGTTQSLVSSRDWNDIDFDTTSHDIAGANDHNTPMTLVRRDATGSFAGQTIVGNDFHGHYYGNCNVDHVVANDIAANLFYGDVIGSQALFYHLMANDVWGNFYGNCYVNHVAANDITSGEFIGPLYGDVTGTHITANDVASNVFIGPLVGNADTATKLATSRTITLTGDVTGTGSFDGSGNLSIASTVASAGKIGSKTYNETGLADNNILRYNANVGGGQWEVSTIEGSVEVDIISDVESDYSLTNKVRSNYYLNSNFSKSNHTHAASAPAAHAASHGTGQADVITVAQSQVTGLVDALSGKSDTGHTHATYATTSDTIALVIALGG